MYVAKSEASATLAGREFHTGIVLGKKLCFRQSDLADRCLYLNLWLDQSFDGADLCEVLFSRNVNEVIKTL